MNADMKVKREFAVHTSPVGRIFDQTKKKKKRSSPHGINFPQLLDLHHALDLRGVERIDQSLPPGDLKMRLAVGKGCGDRGRIGEAAILVKAVYRPSPGVLPNVVVGELGGSPKERSEKGKNLGSGGHSRCACHGGSNPFFFFFFLCCSSASGDGLMMDDNG
ncbi:hypothetical protein HPP92_010030 [Vanilla planifolia]|uniref:Uncharacterized protein n=1 Tax=Vanilla planifolia TaxID=51239 RepID=A0A835V3P0_VANPL|nr:hypothetical protein HPP92_010030 [Vanilla planifolia]